MRKGIIIHSLIVSNGKILILKRIKDTFLGEYWDLPGGTLEDGEDPIEGAIRETKEETALNISNLTLFSYNSVVDQPKDTQFLTLIFLAEYNGNPNIVQFDRKEHDEYQWIKLKELENFKTIFWLTESISMLKKNTELLKSIYPKLIS